MANLGSGNDNINIDGATSSFVDFGGADTYTILSSLSGDVTITDNQASTINLPAGLTISDALFLADGVQFTINGNTVTLLGNPALYTFVFGGTPLDPTDGTPLSFADTAAAFGTTVPAPGEAPNAATTTGEINGDGTVGADDGTVGLSIADASVVEGDAGNTAMEFTITLDEAAAEDVTFDFNTEALTGNAEAGVDYVGTAVSPVTIAAGDTSVTVTVDVIGDLGIEDDETFGVTISNASANATITNGTATGTIIDDDTPTFELTGPATVDEGQMATFTVTASKPVSVDTDVTFQLAPGDATAPDQGTSNTNLNDFAQGAFTEVTVTILAGETTAEFDVESLNDSITELSEDFTVTATVDGTDLAPVTTSIIDGGGETFVLTTGVDLIPGTANDDTIIGFVEEDGAGNQTATSTFTAGDNINGGDGEDTLEIINLAEDILNFNGKTILNVENLLITNADANFNYANIANKMFDTVTIDTGGDSNLGNFDIDNINAASAVVLENFGADFDQDVNLNFQTTSALTGVTDITVSDVDLNELYLDIDAEFTDATDYTFNFTGENVDANDNFNVNANIDLDAADIMLEVNVVLNNFVSDTDGYFELDFNTNGVEMATVNVTMTDADPNEFYIDIDNLGNGTGTEDVANITLTDVDVDDNLEVDHVEFINMVINGEVFIDDMEFYDYEGDVELNIVANGNLFIDGDLNMNDNAFNQTVTITGAGNVDLGDLDLVSDANTMQIVDASLATGDITVYDSNNALDMFTSNTGNDTLILGTFETMAVMGDGDDFVDTNGYDYGDANASTLDGGDGANDTIAIDDAAEFDADTADNISNFEILEIGGGTGAYDLSLEASLNGVSITNDAVAGAGATSVTGAPAGTTLDFIITEGGNDTLSDTTFTFALEDDTGTDDSLNISFFASDDDTDTTAEEQITAGLTADGIETINIMSMAETLSEESAPGADDALTPGDYTNTFTFIGDDAEEITISGDSMFDLTLGTATAAPMIVSLIDATANTGGVMIDASVQNVGVGVNIVAVSFNGSDADDMFMASEIGDVIQGNGGADDITLDVFGLNAVEETIRYVDAADSQITFTDGDDDGDADTFAGQDAIDGFVAGEDKIELSSLLGLATGDARSALNQLGSFTPTEDLADVFEGFGADFFDDGLVDRAVAFLDDGTDGYVFVDANSDGDFSIADDMVIELTGVTALTISDFTFG